MNIVSGVNNNINEQSEVNSTNSVAKNTKTRSNEKWTELENTQLSDCFQKYGSNWEAIAKDMPGRDAKQCMDQWISLNSVKKLGKWSSEEDDLLKMRVDKYGENWLKIAEGIIGRNNSQCRKRYQGSVCPSVKHGEWSDKENKRLSKYVKKHKKRWHKIAAKIPGRTPEQCRLHWIRVLNPAIKREEWSEAEDELLKSLVIQHGNKWKKIAKKIPGRTDTQCISHHRTLCSTIKYGKWVEEEDNRLTEIVQRLGVGNWALIAKEMSDRTEDQCKRRWEVLNPECKSNKKRTRSETGSSNDERPLKKLKETFTSQSLDEENITDVNIDSTQIDSTKSNQSHNLVQPQDAIILKPDFQTLETSSDALSIADQSEQSTQSTQSKQSNQYDLTLMKQDLASPPLEKQQVLTNINTSSTRTLIKGKYSIQFL